MMWFTQVHQHLPKTVDSKVEELAHVNSWEAERGGTAERRTPRMGVLTSLEAIPMTTTWWYRLVRAINAQRR